MSYAGQGEASRQPLSTTNLRGQGETRSMSLLEMRIQRAIELAEKADRLSAGYHEILSKVAGPRPVAEIKAVPLPTNNPGPIGHVDSLDYQLHRLDKALAELESYREDLSGIVG